MKLLVVEPDPGGHHFIPYLLFFARQAQARGIEVSLLTTEAATRHPAMAMLQAGLARPLQVHPMPGLAVASGRRVAGLLQAQWNYWQAVATGFRNLPADARPDHVLCFRWTGLTGWWRCAARRSAARRSPACSCI